MSAAGQRSTRCAGAIGLTPRKIAAASDAALIAAAARGGVYPELRAARMREAARLVLDEFGGDVATVLREEPKRRRRLLKKFRQSANPVWIRYCF